MDKLPLALDFFSAISCRFPGGRVETKVLWVLQMFSVEQSFSVKIFLMWCDSKIDTVLKKSMLHCYNFDYVLQCTQTDYGSLFKTNWMSNNFLTELAAAKRIGSKLGRSWS